MQPTRRALAVLLVTALPLAAIRWSPFFAWIAAGWLMLVLALWLADVQLTPTVEAWALAREHDDRLSLAVRNRIAVTLRLRRGLRALPVWLRDEPPVSFGIDEGDRILMGTVAVGDTQTFRYHVRPPRRGDYTFGDLHLRWRSVLGLFRRQATFPAEEAVKVYPNLVDIKKYDLLLRKNRLWEMGLRDTRVLGSGTEFERLREYVPDDEFRRIDWKATARRGKPISVEYETERSQNIVALLDVGRTMRSPVGDVAKVDYAVNAVLMLAYVATQKGDKVGLLVFADDVQAWRAPRSGKGQFHRMLETLYAVESQPVEPDYRKAFGYLAARQSKRSLVLTFTDLTGSIGTDALVAYVGRLSRHHLPLVVTVGDPAIQTMARQQVDDSRTLYRRTAAERVLDERRLSLDRLRRRGVLTLDVPADELSVEVINRYLELKARMRL